MSDPVATGAAADAADMKVDSSIKLFVGNLAFTTTSESLGTEFSSVGDLASCDVIFRVNGKRTRSLGYGFVSYATRAEADEAVAKYNQKEFEGRQLNVEVALERKELKEKREKRPPRERKTKAVPKAEGDTPSAEEDAAATNESAAKPKKKRGKKRAPVERAESATLVFVANLPFDMTDSELATLFVDYKTTSCNIVTRYNGRSMGYGFVNLESHEEQLRAIAGVHGVMTKDREIAVKAALDKLAVKPNEEATAATE